MKAFEKWWQYNNYGKHRTPGPKEVWRAALKWVKDNCNLYDYDGGWEGYIIEEELGEEDENP